MLESNRNTVYLTTFEVKEQISFQAFEETTLNSLWGNVLCWEIQTPKYVQRWFNGAPQYLEWSKFLSKTARNASIRLNSYVDRWCRRMVAPHVVSRRHPQHASSQSKVRSVLPIRGGSRGADVRRYRHFRRAWETPAVFVLCADIAVLCLEHMVRHFTFSHGCPTQLLLYHTYEYHTRTEKIPYL